MSEGNEGNIMQIFFEILDRYIKQSETDYAIHLDGLWGSGKTYFVKNEVKNYIEEHYELQLVYVSLNGLKSVDEIGEMVFFQMIDPIFAKGYKFAMGSSSLLKNVSLFGFSFETDLSKGENRIQKTVTHKNLDKVLLCFDDLERIDPSISLQSVLGFINSNFIEHNHAKTLFISDSTQIIGSEEGEKVFNKIREKVIRRNIHFTLDIEKVIGNIIVDDRYPMLKNFYDNNVDEINSMLTSIQDLNLRTLKFVCDITEETFQVLAQKDLTNEQLMNIFTCILVISIQYKKGKLKDIEEAQKKLNPYNLYGRTKNNKSNEIQNQFFESVLITNNYVFFEPLAEFIITGHLNKGLLKKDVSQKYMKLSDEEYSLQVIYNYFDYELDEVKEKAKHVVNLIKNGKYKATTYPAVYEKIEEMMEKGYVSFDKPLIDTFKKGLEIVLEKDKEIKTIVQAGDHIQKRYFNGFVSKGAKELVYILEDRIKKEKEVEQFEKIYSFVESIKTLDIKKLNKVLEFYKASQSLFEYLYKVQFYKELPKLQNKSINLFHSVLHEIYLRINNAYEFYSSEINNAQNFKDLLNNEMYSVDIDRLKLDLLKSTIELLDKVIVHINPPRKTNK